MDTLTWTIGGTRRCGTKLVDVRGPSCGSRGRRARTPDAATTPSPALWTEEQLAPEPVHGAGRRRSTVDRGILALAVPALGALVAEPLFVLVDSRRRRPARAPHRSPGWRSRRTVLVTVVGLCVFLAYATTAAGRAAARGGRRARSADASGSTGCGSPLGLGTVLAARPRDRGARWWWPRSAPRPGVAAARRRLPALVRARPARHARRPGRDRGAARPAGHPDAARRRRRRRRRQRRASTSCSSRARDWGSPAPASGRRSPSSRMGDGARGGRRARRPGAGAVAAARGGAACWASARAGAAAARPDAVAAGRHPADRGRRDRPGRRRAGRAPGGRRGVGAHRVRARRPRHRGAGARRARARARATSARRRAVAAAHAAVGHRDRCRRSASSWRPPRWVLPRLVHAGPRGPRRGHASACSSPRCSCRWPAGSSCSTASSSAPATAATSRRPGWSRCVAYAPAALGGRAPGRPTAPRAWAGSGSSFAGVFMVARAVVTGLRARGDGLDGHRRLSAPVRQAPGTQQDPAPRGDRVLPTVRGASGTARRP